MTAVDIPGPATSSTALDGRRRRPQTSTGAASRLRSDLPLLVADAFLVAGCYSAALLLRFDGVVPATYRDRFPRFIGLALAAHLGANWALGLYRQVWRHASMAEARCVISSTIAATTGLLLVSLVPARQPLSVVVMGGAATLLASGAVRFQSRLFALNPSPTATSGLRVAVVGAGEAGATIVRVMRRNPSAGLVPVAVLDDDPRTHGRSLAGVEVVGPIDGLAHVVRRLRVADLEASLVPRVPPEPARTTHGPLVLLGAPCPATNAVFHALVAAFGDVTVVMEPRLSRSWVARRRVRRLGLATVAGQVLFSLLVVPVLCRRGRNRIAGITRDHDLDTSPIDQPVLDIPSVNSEEARRLLGQLHPSVVVISGTRIICPETLESIDVPFLNVHAGVAPQYRGVHGAYWALAEGRADMAGTTVHLVDAGIDTGPIVGQANIGVTDDDSFVTYTYLQLAAGLPILTDAVKRLLVGDDLE
ncbi:MAG: formyltransferase family protein, partial [Nocardioidaceae bacterium]